MKLIVGLGNPGEKYENTRHNVGFIALDTILKKYTKLKKTEWSEEKKFKSLTAEVEIEGEKIVLLKPTTFMNNSGEAIQLYSSYFKIKPEDICIVHDDLDLPLGKIRIRFGGASGGHNGVESILERLGTDKFLRIRLGIGHPGRTGQVRGKNQTSEVVGGYVLAAFTAADKSKTRTMVNQTVKDVALIVKHGIDLYMSKYNK
ncbi:MAG: aminoacyl-tRNA hydrolase [Candidatus Levyibacteriota bacterium]